MTRIECACAICKDNASRIGQPLPLAALVNDDVLAKVGNGKAAIHGLVYTIHDPFMQRAVAKGSAVAIGVPVNA